MLFSLHRKTAPVLALGLLSGAATGFLLRNSPPSTERKNTQKITVVRGIPGGAQAAGKPLRPRTRALLEALWSPRTPSGQIAAALEWSKLTSVEDIRDLLDHSRLFPSHSGEEVAIGVLLQRWLELDPQEAMAYCRRSNPDFIARMAGSWSLMAPEATADWVRALPAGNEKQTAWLQLCQAAATHDPAKGWEMLAAAPSSDGGWKVDGVVSHLVSLDVEKAMAALSTLPPFMVAAAGKAIAAQLSAQDPRRGWEWACQLPNPHGAMAASLATAIGRDPALTLGFIRAMPSDVFESVVGQSSLYNWQCGRLKEFVSLMTEDTTLDPAGREFITDRLFGRAMYSDPAAAQDFVPFLSKSKLAETIPDYVRHWARTDEAGAKAWAGNLPEGPGRTAALEGLIFVEASKTGVGTDRTSSDSLVREFKQGMYLQPDDPRIGRLTHEEVGLLGATAVASGSASMESQRFKEVMEALAGSNPAAGAAWLRTGFTDDRNIGPAAAMFSARWAENDSAAAIAWVESLPPGRLAEVAALNVARMYDRYDPANALLWMETLPPGPVKEAARKVVGVSP